MKESGRSPNAVSLEIVGCIVVVGFVFGYRLESAEAELGVRVAEGLNPLFEDGCVLKLNPVPPVENELPIEGD